MRVNRVNPQEQRADYASSNQALSRRSLPTGYGTRCLHGVVYEENWFDF